MPRKSDPTYETPDTEPGSVKEPDGTEFVTDDEAFVDAFVARNREALIKSFERADRDFAEGRGIPWEDVEAKLDAMLDALEVKE